MLFEKFQDDFLGTGTELIEIVASAPLKCLNEMFPLSTHIKCFPEKNIAFFCWIMHLIRGGAVAFHFELMHWAAVY